MDRIEAMRLFVRLVELHSVSAAAKELRIKQSTASKWLARLEEEHGVTLIERTTRAKRLSEAGLIFYQHTKNILSHYEALTAELQVDAGEPTGRLRVSVPVVFGRLFIVAPVACFLKEFPKVEVELTFDDDYVNLVDDGFDVAIRIGVPVDTSLRMRALGKSKRLLVGAPDYLRRFGEPSEPSQLSLHDCLLHDNALGIWTFNRAAAQVRATVSGRFVANNSEALLHMAREGVGLALLADWLVAPDLAANRLVSLMHDFEAVPAPIHALVPSNRVVQPRVKAFLDYLSASLASRFGAATAPLTSLELGE